MTPPRAAGTVELFSSSGSSLLEVVDHVLNQGVVVTGDVVLSIAEVDLVYLRVSALLCAADRLLPPAPEAEKPSLGSRPKRGRREGAR